MTAPGDVVAETYRVREVLTGGMGQILICDWATDTADEGADPSGAVHAQVALKSFQRRFFFNSAARVAFVREASTWLRLSDLPHVMPVIGIETIDDRPFIVMAAVPPGPRGERSVADLLHHGPLQPQSALAFALQIGLALEGVSRRIPGLVHGDLKPANALLLGDNVYLSDFGLVSAVSLGLPDARLEGTWGYRAPELWNEDARPTVATDVYAFGVMLYEMLVGRLPLAPSDDSRDGWATAHRDLPPDVPADWPTTGLVPAATGLALRCLAKDAGERPQNFADVVQRIRAIYGEFDPAELLMLLLQAHRLAEGMRLQATETRSARIRSLLALGEAKQALEELDTIPVADYDDDLWVIRGTALSLANRPDEALEALEHALAGDLPPADRTGAMSEYALALKRLDRFDEAQQIYEELLSKVPDDQLPIVAINLATVYLEQGRGDEALELLESFVRKNPEVPEAWGNLGESYALVGRYQEAVRAFGRALLLAPQDGAVRVRLAAVQMDHLGDLEQAWMSLDAAFDSGHESRESFVRTLASSLLLDRQETVQGMLWAAKNNMPEDLAQSLLDESVEMARSLARKFGGEVDPEDPLAEGGVRETVEAVPEEAAPEDAPTESSGEAGTTPEPSIPFLNFRYYDFRDFTMDYYQWPEADDYLPDLLAQWRRAMRDPRFGAGSASLRGAPFYFTICPGCSITVLTNRDIGKQIKCRMCGTAWPTSPVHGPPFDEVVAKVSAELGIEQPREAGPSDVYILFVQAPDTEALATVEEVCRECGMAPLENNRLISVHMLREATRRGIASFGPPWSVWTLTPSEVEPWAAGSTPRAITQVVGQLQDRVPEVITLSTTLTADEMAGWSATVEEVGEQEEQNLRLAIRSGNADAPALRRLATLLESRGEHAEAESKARAAVAADESSAEGWEILGKTLLDQGDFPGARDALNESLAHDPTSVPALIMLARSYHELGDEALASEHYARAISHSGGAPP